jgi:probable F420-dependent oxidoreductase
MMGAMQLGKIGVWRRRQFGTAALAELEELGYGAFWIGSSPAVEEARPFLEATATMTIATGILNIWRHDPAEVAARHAELAREFPGRFLLGIGVGHPEATSEYSKPLTAMGEFFDGLDAGGVPRDERVAAALGPKMLDLGRERSLGAHPYFAPPEHTRLARERLGPDALLAPEVAVVVEEDAETARRHAREYAATYLAASNYTRNLTRLGFGERDFAAGGSDHLIDTVIPHGSAGRVAETVRAHLAAGADHVCLQPIGHDAAPLADYRALARKLIG